MPDGFFGKLKGVYAGLEEKWYAALDAIDRSIHIYPVIDKIDSVFPSFILFCSILLIALLAVAGIAGLVFFGTSSINASIKVIDDSSTPIGGVEVNILSGGQALSAYTDDYGQLMQQIPDRRISVEVLQDGYANFTNEYEVTEGSQIIIRLSRVQVPAQQKYITVVDASGNTIQQAIQVRFSCSTGKGTPPQLSRANGNEFNVQVAAECGTPTATVTSSGFEPATRELSALKTTISLFTAELQTGTIQAYVKDSSTGDPIPGIKLMVYSSESIHFNTGITDDSGTKEFTVRPGTYFIRAVDEDNGDYSSEDSSLVEVSAGSTETVTILLSESLSEGKQLFIKFIDKADDSAVEGVKIRLYQDGLFLTEHSSDSEGIIRFLDRESESEYSILATHTDFVTKAMADVELLDDSEDEPAIVKLEKASQQNSGTARAMLSKAEGGAIPNERIFLFNPDYNFEFGVLLSDDNGTAVFTNLPPAEYYAMATSESYEGSSGVRQLVAGQTLVLPIVLVLKQGHIDVSVSAEDGNAVADATVKFYAYVDGSLLAEETTASDGKAERVSLPWTEKVYFTVEKDGFLKYSSSGIAMQPDSASSFSIRLRRTQAAVLDIDLIEIMDKENNRQAQQYKISFSK